MQGIEEVRRFNRAVTLQIGALDSEFLGRNRSLGACRLLFEIGSRGVEVRQLRARLELDSGYLSRLLRGLEAEGLIRTRSSPTDARVRFVTPTPAGRRELALLNRRSDTAAVTLLTRLPEPDRTALLTAMGVVERLLRASAVEITVQHPNTRAARSCMGRYFEELAVRFEAGFDPALSITASAADLIPPHGFFLLATLQRDPVGCGALKCHRDFGEIKRMWVAPSARGLGIGRRILLRLEEIAREQRVPLLRLETNKTLTEAQSLYRRNGYTEVPRFNDEPYAHHWFQKRL
jgi:DNA-binding MarR family transcriptional regulator/GNAT superfamily N-acetyltransferase